MSTKTKAILLLASSSALTGADAEIQYMPPGRHKISPLGPEGAPVDMEVTVDEQLAQRLEAERARLQAEADAGRGDEPFLDFNHDDGPASAHPKEFFWGGDDPVTGGIRVRLEWTNDGRAAVEGKAFRRFSPAFLADEETDDIVGLDVNMGGLVNRAAFRTIQKLAATTTPTTTTIMDPNKLQAQLTDLEARLASLEEENTTLKARATELEEENKTLKATVAETEEARAKEAVDVAAKEGRIAPDPEVKDKWVKAIRADKDATTLLAGLPVNPAFKTVVRATGAAPGTDEKPTTPAMRIAATLKRPA